jgi:hypothetical protein
MQHSINTSPSSGVFKPHLSPGSGHPSMAPPFAMMMSNLLSPGGRHHFGGGRPTTPTPHPHSPQVRKFTFIELPRINFLSVTNNEFSKLYHHFFPSSTSVKDWHSRDLMLLNFAHICSWKEFQVECSSWGLQKWPTFPAATKPWN